MTKSIFGADQQRNLRLIVYQVSPYYISVQFSKDYHHYTPDMSIVSLCYIFLFFLVSFSTSQLVVHLFISLYLTSSVLLIHYISIVTLTCFITYLCNYHYKVAGPLQNIDLYKTDWKNTQSFAISTALCFSCPECV